MSLCLSWLAGRRRPALAPLYGARQGERLSSNCSFPRQRLLSQPPACSGRTVEARSLVLLIESAGRLHDLNVRLALPRLAARVLGRRWVFDNLRPAGLACP